MPLSVLFSPPPPFRRYFIDWKSNVDNFFTIDGTEGTIATNELLDRENTAQYNFSIVASKISKYKQGGKESLYSESNS